MLMAAAINYAPMNRDRSLHTEYPILRSVSSGCSKDVASLRPPSTKRRRVCSSLICAVAVSGSCRMDSICSASASYWVLLRLILSLGQELQDLHGRANVV